MENKTILITGGSGLIGSHLTQLLLDIGYHVRHLSRSAKPAKHDVEVFAWDVYKGEIDERCIDGVSAIIHLAGEGIAKKRWTAKRKMKIIQSRTASIDLIYKLLERKAHKVEALISASAVGFYGDRGDGLLTEESPSGSGFLAESCREWEKAVDAEAALGLRIVKLRTGLVLAREGGALPQMDKLVRLGLGAALGSGSQWQSWIHIKDAVKMYLFALENAQISGNYNMATSHPVTNQELTKAIAQALKKPLWLPNVPAFALKLALGEMSEVVLSSTRVSAEKIMQQGFRFEFNKLAEALEEIYR
ncbi:MAG: hypothetical protein K0S09_2199 [Sphingobacteriaceae bacterium]|nr:hypothetical protein [Sphingobacteriaceae bacterium]